MVVPQAWITTALLAAAAHFGPVRLPETHHAVAGPIRVEVKHLPPSTLGEASWPASARGHAVIRLSPRALGIKERVQCVLIHEYGHLALRPHSTNPRSIMYARLNPATCHAWLRRHHVS